jgi:Flp pilus assembly secretin CpaC
VPLGSQLNATVGDQAALAILGELSTAVSAAGTTQATATLLTTATSIVTTVAAGSGVRLPVTPTVSAGDRLHVANHGALTLSVYPPTGGKLSNNTANVPALVAPKKSADFLCLNGTDYSVMLGS